jgi:hypothetical protein
MKDAVVRWHDYMNPAQINLPSVCVETDQCKRSMTELEKYDTNGNGKLDPEEMLAIELEDRRRRMEDEDAQRDQQRKMVWFVLFGMLGYPLFVIFSAVFGLDQASDILR